MLLANKLDTKAKRTVPFGGGIDGGVLEVPQSTRSMGTIEIRIEQAIFLTGVLTDMPDLSLWDFEGRNHTRTSRPGAGEGKPLMKCYPFGCTGF